jgi:hypothetical protein
MGEMKSPSFADSDVSFCPHNSNTRVDEARRALILNKKALKRRTDEF